MYLKTSLLLICAISSVSVLGRTLGAVLSAHPSLTILNGLLQQFDLLDWFDSAENVTLLAPTDSAYEALAKWGFNVSEVPAPVAKALLSYHLLDGEYTSQSILGLKGLQVVHSYLRPPVLTNVTRGAAVKLSGKNSGEIVTESGLSVIGGTVETDIAFDNGVLHTLNSSMVLPHNISATAALGQMTGFLDAIGDSSMVDELEAIKDVTLFIPRNSAVDKISPLLALLKPSQLANVVRYHAIPGKVLYHDVLTKVDSKYKTAQGDLVRIHSNRVGDVFVNDARIVRPDLIIYGGVAHIVDEVLIPKGRLTGGLRGLRVQVP